MNQWVTAAVIREIIGGLIEDHEVAASMRRPAAWTMPFLSHGSDRLKYGPACRAGPCASGTVD